MSWQDLLLRLRALRHPARAESELDEELAFHLEMEARKKQAAGVDAAEARRRARVEFNGVERVREECRDIRGLAAIQNLARDVRYGARVLRKTPVFTAVAVLSLAIGIGANTAVFSLVDTVLLRMLPVSHPEQLVVVKWGGAKPMTRNTAYSTGSGDAHGGWTLNVFSWPVFAEMRARSGTMKSIIGFSPLYQLTIVAGGQAITTGGVAVTGNYFSALGVQPILGRPLVKDDDSAGGAVAAVISYRLWERAFGLDPGAVGKTVYINRQPCTIVGVTPRQFFGVSPGGFGLAPEVDITLPIRAKERLEGAGAQRISWFGPDISWIQAIGRMERPGNDAAIKAELAGIVGANLPEVNKRELAPEGPRVFIEPAARGLGRLRKTLAAPLLVLMAVVGLTLLMACANLAGLLLARAAARRKEIMVRLALGAGRARLVRQLLIEGALLSTAGATAGLAVAYCGVEVLLAFAASRATPILIEVRPDARVLGFTVLASIVTTFLFALAPALSATRVDVAGGLKEDTPQAGGHFGSVRVLIAVQVAVALLLVTAAALFTRSLANFRSLPLGFNPRNVVVFDLAPGKGGYDEARGNQLYARVTERLRQVRGVTGVTASTSRLMNEWLSNGPIVIEETGKRGGANFNFVGADFLDVIQIPIVMGRGIGQPDINGNRKVAVINETVARKYFRGGSPVGKRFRWSKGDAEAVEVIGVARDALYNRLEREAPATIYAPYTQVPWGWPQSMSFEVRVAAGTAEALTGIRRAIADIDPMLPLMDVKTIEDQIDGALAEQRLFAWLVGLFGAITVALACMGIYGLAACSVASRTREIGVRMALGASGPSVVAMVLRHIALTVAAGLAAGIPATLAVSRIIEAQLFGVKARDPLSLALSAVAVIVLAMLAAALPAARAMRIDPVRALRYE